MKISVFIAFGMLILVIAVAVIVFAIGKYLSPKPGFKDVVKNPGYWKQIASANAEMDDGVRASKAWSDQKVASVTRDFILEVKLSRNAESTARVLRELGARTHTTVLAILSDPSLHERLVRPTGEDLSPEAPFNRACDVLGDAPPWAAAEALAPFLNDPSVYIRKAAILAIAKTGAPTIVPDLKKAFSDSDDYVRAYALIGLEFTLNRSGLSDDLRKDLFSPVWTLLKEGKNEDKAAGILFRLNGEKAKNYFLSEEVFQADSPILHDALKTLADAHVPVSRDRLLPLIQNLESKKLDYPRTYALSSALRLLGQQKDEKDREFLRLRTSHPEESVAEGASAGLLGSYDLEDFEKKIWEKEDRSGYASLSRPQKLYVAVMGCNAEVNNGGFSQYFVNSSGDHWPDAVAGFEAMGIKERLVLVKKAVAFFGKDGPSTDRDLRQEQLARLSRENDSLFDALETKYYASKENVEVYLTRYVLEHPEEFR